MSRMPVARTSFLGRADDLDGIRSAFDAGARLITIHGPAGAGKTRLAVRYAETSQGAVWFCDLTEAEDEKAVVAAIARALGIVLDGSDPIARLGEALADSPSLVVIDNCEQIVAGVANVLGRLLELAPRTVWLATSRDALRVEGEHVHELAGLASADAVALFVERVRLRRRDYRPSDSATAAVLELVQKLDGLPLAIELAAASAGVLSERQLVERLAPLDLVGPRDKVARHRTLRAAIDGSWAMLSSREQTVLARLSIFSGGFTLEAAERVAGPLEGIASALESLADKSLVRSTVTPLNDLRFHLYESVRAYAVEKLRTSGEEDAVRRSHATGMLALVEPWARGVDRHGGQERALRLGLEIENLSAVHAWALARGEGALALRAAAAAGPYLAIHGPTERHLQMLDEALACPTPSELALLRGQNLVLRGLARWRRGLPDLARADLEEAMQIDDPSIVGRALRVIALLDWEKGLAPEAQKTFERSIELLERSGDEVFEARARGDLARLLADSGRLVESRALFDRALDAFARVGSVRDEGLYRINLAIAFHREGELDRARSHYEEALAMLRAAGIRRFAATALENLGLLHQEEGRMDDARSCFEEAEIDYRAIADRRSLGTCVANLGGLAHEIGEWSVARMRYREAIVLLDRAGRLQRSALVRAALGATLAALGDVDLAKRELDAADAVLESDPILGAAASLYRGHLDLATGIDPRSRLAAAEGFLRKSDEVRLASRLLSVRVRDRDPLLDRDVLVIEASGLWFRPPHGEKIVLEHRPSLRGILAAFARQTERVESDPGLDVDDLRASGWPGESMTESSGASRVYTALSMLRNMGLRDALESHRGRHRLARTAKLAIVSAKR